MEARLVACLPSSKKNFCPNVFAYHETQVQTRRRRRRHRGRRDSGECIRAARIRKPSTRPSLSPVAFVEQNVSGFNASSRISSSVVTISFTSVRSIVTALDVRNAQVWNDQSATCLRFWSFVMPPLISASASSVVHVQPVGKSKSFDVSRAAGSLYWPRPCQFWRRSVRMRARSSAPVSKFRFRCTGFWRVRLRWGRGGLRRRL